MTYTKGCSIWGERADGIPDAVEAARAADVAVVFVGGRSGLLPDSTSGEFRDASDLALRGRQQELVDAIVDTGTPTVVVLMSGRVHSLARIAERAQAVMYAWCPGEQGGAALADVLFGDEAPSGKLPISIPGKTGQVPVHHDVRAGGGRSAIFGAYVDGSNEPAYPFGHGLSYTTFAYSDLAIDHGTTDDDIVVRVTVANTGDRAGTEVVQLLPARRCGNRCPPREAALRLHTGTARPGRATNGSVHRRPERARVLRRSNAPGDRSRRSAVHGGRSHCTCGARRQTAGDRAQRPAPDRDRSVVIPTLAAVSYVDPDEYERERHAVFARQWQLAGFRARIAVAG